MNRSIDYLREELYALEAFNLSKDVLDSLVQVENLFFGPNGQEPDVKFNKMIKMKKWLDDNWFPGVAPKHNEEASECIEAYDSFLSGNAKYKDSLRFAAISEFSDYVISVVSACIQGHISSKTVENHVKNFKERIEQVSERHGKDEFSKFTRTELRECHYKKIEEIYEAAQIYTKQIKTESGPWCKFLLRLYTPDELFDSDNKMKISKEIRRMRYYSEYFDKK